MLYTAAKKTYRSRDPRLLTSSKWPSVALDMFHSRYESSLHLTSQFDAIKSLLNHHFSVPSRFESVTFLVSSSISISLYLSLSLSLSVSVSVSVSVSLCLSLSHSVSVSLVLSSSTILSVSSLVSSSVLSSSSTTFFFYFQHDSHVASLLIPIASFIPCPIQCIIFSISHHTVCQRFHAELAKCFMACCDEYDASVSECCGGAGSRRNHRLQ